MNQELLIQCRQSLKKLITDGILRNKKIFLFGMNTPGDEIILFLQDYGYKIQGILDNNPENSGKQLMRINVFQPEECLQQYCSNNIFLIASRHYESMKEQLMRLGYKENIHIFQIINLSCNINFTDTQESFQEQCIKAQSAVVLFQKLTNNLEENAHFLLCPIKANGDIYFLSALYRQYKQQIGALPCYIISVGDISKKIAALFELESVVLTISQTDMDLLLLLAAILGKECKLIVAHPCQLHTSICDKLDGYKKMTFLDYVAYSRMGLDFPYYLQKPCQILTDIQKKLYYQQYGLKKSIILSPFANSIPKISHDFWELLAEKLATLGYVVYTNSSGEEEPCIKGTEPIFIPISHIPEALSCVEAIISIRNGLCDVVSSASCKKIILYPDKSLTFGTLIDYYSLNQMKLCDDAIELIYKGDAEQMLFKILELLKIIS